MFFAKFEIGNGVANHVEQRMENCLEIVFIYLGYRST